MTDQNQTNQNRGGTAFNAPNVPPVAGPAGVFESLDALEQSLKSAPSAAVGGGAGPAPAGEPARLLSAATDPEFCVAALREIYGGAADLFDNDVLRLPEPKLRLLARMLANYLKFKKLNVDPETLALVELAIVAFVVNAPVVRSFINKSNAEKAVVAGAAKNETHP
jgi:hypothetical protein